ncbi:MAG: hypothetical protein HONBIEJF_00616 [Fimbriimonadaceae bacterium]|nr:hypothetical protein [Fimbriimonadaceae bacterium]
MQRFLVECDFLEGKATNSLELVRRAVDGYESFGDRRQAAAARVVAADLLNDAASSLDDLRQAAEQLIGFREEFHDPSSAAQASKPLAEVGGRLVHALCTLGDVAGAWEWLQKLRERRPSAPADRTDSERSRELRAEIEAIGRDLAAATDGHDALRRRQEVALAELSAGEFRSSSTAGSVEWCEIPDLTQARSSIEPNVVLVEAVVSPTAIHMIAVSNDELRHRQLDAPQEDVADAVAACRQAISGPGGRWVAHPLLEPLAKHLRELSNGFELLVWCPDGALEGVPIGPWLLEGETAWMQSGSSCYWLSTVPTAAGRPLVAGISEHSSSLGHLPEARREAELVAGILGDCRLLLDEEATVANVRAGSTVARILHVATHAVANESVPLFSRLEMASGPLYGRDLLDWGLASELVFLSACSTAEGQRSASGSSLGLAWAMLAGGARTVVASSWPVHDHAAQIWVERFYQSYVVNGNAAQAHQAACRYLASESPYDAPHYWATWKVLGSR